MFGTRTEAIGTGLPTILSGSTCTLLDAQVWVKKRCQNPQIPIWVATKHAGGDAPKATFCCSVRSDLVDLKKIKKI
jgi:hypothetical protein